MSLQSVEAVVFPSRRRGRALPGRRGRPLEGERRRRFGGGSSVNWPKFGLERVEVGKCVDPGVGRVVGKAVLRVAVAHRPGAHAGGPARCACRWANRRSAPPRRAARAQRLVAHGRSRAGRASCRAACRRPPAGRSGCVMSCIASSLWAKRLSLLVSTAMRNRLARAAAPASRACPGTGWLDWTRRRCAYSKEKYSHSESSAGRPMRLAQQRARAVADPAAHHLGLGRRAGPARPACGSARRRSRVRCRSACRRGRTAGPVQHGGHRASGQGAHGRVATTLGSDAEVGVQRAVPGPIRRSVAMPITAPRRPTYLRQKSGCAASTATVGSVQRQHGCPARPASWRSKTLVLGMLTTRTAMPSSSQHVPAPSAPAAARSRCR